MFKFFAAWALALPALTSAASMPTGAWPTSAGTVQYSSPYVVKAGTVFDGGMKTYERSNVKCTGDAEGGKDEAVFLVEPGATLKNVIIGANQAEGVHCEDHGCTIENVWWNDVCEDALSIKGGSASSVSYVIGGGARSADDKVVQHNGYGTVNIDGFYVQDFGKLYRGCGNCGTKIQRKVVVSNVYAVNPKTALVLVNANYGDVAKLSNIKIQTTMSSFPNAACVRSNAVPKGEEPTTVGSGPDGTVCVYDASEITIVKSGSSTTAPTTTKTATTKPASTTKPATTTKTPSTTKPSTGTAAQYAQCGGEGYNGPTTCASPYKCVFANQWYSQCL